MITYIHHLKDQPFWVLSLSFIGFLSLLKCTSNLLIWIFITFLRPSKNLKKYGSWALITGSTDGIGKALSFQLARKGLNLILVSRNPEKLRGVSSEIQARYPAIKIKVVVLDLSGDVAAGEQAVMEAVEGLDVGVLVNNVGITYPEARFFHEVDVNSWMELVRVNIEGTTRVTRAVLPGMIARKRGAILNMGSGASIIIPSHPLFTVYSSTKSYIDQFSRSLYVEYKHLGIDVQCQIPLFVQTKMVAKIASIYKASFFKPSPDDYAKAAVRRIGYEARCTPYWTHSIQWYLASLTPDAVLNRWRLKIAMRFRKTGRWRME